MSHFPVDFSQLPTKACNLWRKIECHARTITRYLWWARLRVLVPGLASHQRIMRRKHNRSKSRPVSGIKMSIRCAAPSTAVELCGRSSTAQHRATNQTNQPPKERASEYLTKGRLHSCTTAVGFIYDRRK